MIVSLEDELRCFTEFRDSVIPFDDPWMSSQTDSSKKEEVYSKRLTGQ